MRVAFACLLAGCSSAVAPPRSTPAICGEAWNATIPSHPVVDGSVIARATKPILEPARERVCACAAVFDAPDEVTLRIVTTPDDGVATAHVDGDRAFAKCTGTIEARYERWHPGTDSDPDGKASFSVPLRISLRP